jgi:hypothetical protein
VGKQRLLTPLPTPNTSRGTLGNPGCVCTFMSRPSAGRNSSSPWLLYDNWMLWDTAPLMESTCLLPPWGDGCRLNGWRMARGDNPQPSRLFQNTLDNLSSLLGGRLLHRKAGVIRKCCAIWIGLEQPSKGVVVRTGLQTSPFLAV